MYTLPLWKPGYHITIAFVLGMIKSCRACHLWGVVYNVWGVQEPKSTNQCTCPRMRR